MNVTLTTYSRCSRRRGLTLIEVVAAIAILGTILVGVVLARARHTRQLASAGRIQLATRLADDQLTAWWASPQGVPIGESGVFEAEPTLTWRTREVVDDTMADLAARVVRVEVRDTRSTPGRALAAEQLLFVVDLLLPTPLPQSQPTGSAWLDPNRSPAGRSGRAIDRRSAPAGGSEGVAR